MIKGKLSLFIIFSIIVALTGATGTFIAINMSKANKITKEKLEFIIEKKEKVYDGAPLELKSVELDEEYSLPNGYSYDFICNDTITNVGVIYPNPNIIIYDNYGKNVTALYDCIIKDNGGLSVTKRAINVDYNSASKAYDGTPLNQTTFDVTNGTLALGQRVAPEYKSEAKSIDDGKVNVRAITHILDINGSDVTDNYYITDNLSGDSIPTFEITGNKLVIFSKDAEFTYDGKAHSYKVVDYQGDLITGDKIIVNESRAVVNVDDSGYNEIELDNVDVVDVDGISVKDKYEIEIRNVGVLTVKPYTLRIDKIDAEPIKQVEYTGKVQTFEITDEEIAEYHLLSQKDLDLLGDFKLTGSGMDKINIGKYSLELSVKDDNGNTSNNFEIDPSYKSVLYFEILKRRVDITLNPINVEFDNKVHKYQGNTDEYSYNGEALLEGHSLLFEYDSTKSFKDVGEYTVPGEAKIVDSDEVDVSSNYDIRISDGKIIITKREVNISIQTGATTKLQYSNEPLFENANDLFETDDTTSGFTYSFGYKEDINDVGKYYLKNILVVSAKENSLNLNEENFDFKINSSLCLEVQKRKVNVEKISSAVTEKQFTGESLFKANEIYIINDDKFNYALSFTTEFINEGTYIAKNFLKIDIDNGEISNSKFEFAYDDVTLKILGDDVTIEFVLIDPNNNSKVYDGKPVLATDIYKLSPESIGFLTRKEYTCTYSFKGTLLNRGTYTGNSVLLNVRFEDKNGSLVDVEFEQPSSSYSFTIVRKSITLTTGSATKVYDGTPLYCLDYTVSGLPNDFVFTVDYDGCPYALNVNDGDVKNEFDYTITLDGVNVTNNFNVNDDGLGILRIAQAVLNVYVNDRTITYGDEIDVDTLGYITSGNGTNIQGIDIEPFIDGTIIDADVYNVDESNCKVNIYPGHLTINKKNITIQTKTLSKQYDGTALYDTNPYVTGLVGSDYLVISSYTEITNIGSVDNYIEFYISNGSDDVTNMYNIIIFYGTLTITS